VKPGTTSFEAPEVFQGKEKSQASDGYSFAMIMHELLYHNYSHPWESVFKQCSPQTLASLIIEAVQRGERPKVGDHDNSAYICLMKLYWAREAAERPNFISENAFTNDVFFTRSKQKNTEILLLRPC
jgi:serine/threonine protein kinase